MVRLLLLIAIAAVAWYLYRRIVVAPKIPPTTPPPPAAGPDPVTRCEECGVHVPEKNGVRFQDKFFCGPDHLNSYLRKNGQS